MRVGLPRVPGDFLQSSLSKMDILRTILAWVMCKREELQRTRRKRDHDDKLMLFEQKKTTLERFHNCVRFSYYFGSTRSEQETRTQAFEQETQAFKQEIQALEQETQALERETQALEQETQALEMILHWVRFGGGKEALLRAEDVLDSDKPTHIEQHIMQLLELMEQEYWLTQHSTSPCRGISVRKEIFKTMLEEIPKLIGMHWHRIFGLRNPRLETKFSTTLDKILPLSSWMPSSIRNQPLRELLNALVILNDLGGSEEYHDYLCDFMKLYTTFCAFTLDNANPITTEDSETTADLCRNLQRLAQNLGKIASTKAEQCHKLYENFITHKEDLSYWLDSASLGQGKLYMGFMHRLLHLVHSSRPLDVRPFSTQDEEMGK